MKRMKKSLCLLLATLMLLSALTSLVACGDTSDQEQSTTVKDTAAQETQADTQNQDYVCDLPSLDYGGEDVNVLFAKRPGREDELVSSGGIEAGVLSSAVYERNLAVEELIKVTLNYIPNEDDTVSDKLKNDILSGDGAYDLIADGTYRAIVPVIEGHYKDLNQSDYVDTSKHYWTQGYNDMVTFTEDNKQYLVTGPVAISLFRYMYLTIYNKTLFDEIAAKKGVGDLYETIKNGDWTLDYQYALINETYADNGDSVEGEEDFHGFVTGDTISVDPYLVASDIHMIVKDSETYELVFNTEAQSKLSDLCEKVQKIYNNQSTFVYKGSTMDDVGKTNIIQKFTDKKALMATIQFYSMETNYNDVGALDYGIAPIPKFSKDQSQYYSYVQDQVTGFGIPASVKDNRAEMASATLEAIGYYSYQLVRPAYYETTLSERYMKDPQSLEILELIFDSLYFDFSSTCGNIVTSCVIRDQLRPVLSGKNNTISNKMRSWERSMKNNLSKYNDKLLELEG